MLEFLPKRLLIIAPHPDDEVIGAAGLIQRVKEGGGQVYALIMTVGTNANYSGKISTKKERIAEIKQVADFLKIDGWRIACPGNKHHLLLDDVPQRDLINEIESGEEISVEALQPDMVVFPNMYDYNQDHRAVATASFTACRPCPPQDKKTPQVVASYETPMDWWSHSGAVSRVNLLIPLTEKQVQRKVQAMNMYKSQRRRSGHPRNGDTLRSLAEVAGSRAGTKYAEGFYCHKLTL